MATKITMFQRRLSEALAVLETDSVSHTLDELLIALEKHLIFSHDIEAAITRHRARK